jgi:hypothetical protein
MEPWNSLMTSGSLAMTNTIGYFFIPSAPTTRPATYINIGVTKLDVETVLKMLSPIEVSIIAMTLKALLTGVHLTSFLLCLRWLVFSDDGGTLRKASGAIQLPFLIIAVILFAFSVTDLGVNLQAAFISFHNASIPNTSILDINNDITLVCNPRTELMIG